MIGLYGHSPSVDWVLGGCDLSNPWVHSGDSRSKACIPIAWYPQST